jgi:REP element-mobilizing transposase RayT
MAIGMPNHIHCILFFPDEDYNLNKIVSKGKRFIAYENYKTVTGKEAEQNTFKTERRVDRKGY